MEVNITMMTVAEQAIPKQFATENWNECRQAGSAGAGTEAEKEEAGRRLKM